MPTVEEVRPSLYRVFEESDDKLVSLYLAVGTERTLLVDCGVADTPERTLVPALDQLGLSPAQIDFLVITHADVDHSGGLGALQRLAPTVTTICGAADREMIEDIEVMIDRRYREFRHEHGIDQSDEFASWVRESSEPGQIAVCLGTGRLRLSPDWSVDLLAVPGHSEGHLAILDERNQCLMIGDAVLGIAIPSGDGDDSCPPTYRYVDDYRATIQALRALDAQLLLTAHFPVFAGQEVNAFWTASKDFCSRLENELLDLLVTRGPSTTRSLIDAAADRIRTWPREMDDALVYAVAGHLESLADRGLIELSPDHPVSWTVV